MKLSLQRLLIKCASLFLLVGCLSQIEINTVKRGGQLVVSGQVSTLPDRTTIQLGRTANEERLPFPLTGAYIQLHDDLGNVVAFQEDFLREGYYKIPDFVGTPGATYYIEIFLPDGETFKSASEKIPVSPGSHSVYHDFIYQETVDLSGTILSEPFIRIFVNSEIPQGTEPTFLRWSVEEVYLIKPTDFPDPWGNVPPDCFVTQNADPQSVVLFNGDELKTDRIGDLLVASRLIDRSFHYRHYFTTYQMAITKEAFDYWRKVDVVANQVGSIFDTPPAAIDGNVVRNIGAEPALGYFQAVNEAYQRFYTLPSDLSVPINYSNCTYDPDKDRNLYPSECLNCLSERNSTYVRPPWF